MSFAFRATRQEWDEKYENRRNEEMNINGGDVSVVAFGPNPATAGSSVAVRSRALPPVSLRPGRAAQAVS
jgi:hypothetical protein